MINVRKDDLIDYIIDTADVNYHVLRTCIIHIYSYTGSTLIPASLSTTGATAGCDRIGPTIGKDLRNCTATPKKSPNRPMMPSDSIKNPMKVHLERINNTPSTKKNDPRLLFGRVKNI